MLSRIQVLCLAVAAIMVAGCAGCTSASAGEIVKQKTEVQTQLQTVQPPPTVQYQTRTRQVMTQQQITECVPCEETVMVPEQVTSLETRQRTVMVPKTVTEQVAVTKTQMVPKTTTRYQAQTRTVAVPRTVTETVAVQVQQPPRQVAVQSVAIGMHDTDQATGLLGRLLGGLRK